MIIGTLNCSSTYEFLRQNIDPRENAQMINKQRIYKLAKIISRSSVDILCLQELDSEIAYYLNKRLKGRLITYVPNYDRTDLRTVCTETAKNVWRQSRRHIAYTNQDYNDLSKTNHRFNYIGIYVAKGHKITSIGYGTINRRKGYMCIDVDGIGRVVTAHVPLGVASRHSAESVEGRKMFMNEVLESTINNIIGPIYLAGDLNCLTSVEMKSQLKLMCQYGLSNTDALVHHGLEGTWIGFNHEPLKYQRTMTFRGDDLFQDFCDSSTRFDIIASSNCPWSSIHYALLRTRWIDEDRPLISDHALVLHVYNTTIEYAVEKIHNIASMICAVNNPPLNARSRI